MKIVVFGMPYFNYTKSMCWALENLGYTVMMVENRKTINVNAMKKEMINFKPDIFINFCGNYESNIIDSNFLNNLKSCKKVTIFADAIKFVGDIEQNILLYDKVFVFEPDDITYVKEKYGVDALLSFASVAEEIHCKDFGKVDKKYDLSFVGLMTDDRGVFFEEIAKYAYENKLSMILYGHFWHNKHWWQSYFAKRKFAKKYPNLVRFVKNEYLAPEKAALLYRQTKICINKHIDRHKAMGSRTFEIMANNNFILCDERIQAQEYGLVDGENIVFYKDVNDCKKKIAYYIKNSYEREQISRRGFNLVRERYTTKEVIRRMLGKFI